MDDIPVKLPAHPERFIDQLRAFICLHNLAYKAEKTYVSWVIRFIRFHKLQHPKKIGVAGIESDLTHLDW